MQSLEEQCLLNLAVSIYNMPELMKEKLTNVYESELKKKADEEARIEAEINLKKILTGHLNNVAYMVTRIFDDMIKSMKDNNRPRLDYYLMFPKADPNSVDIAYKNAESMFDDYSNQIVIGSIELNRYGNISDEIESDSEEEVERQYYGFNIYDDYGEDYNSCNYYN